MHRLAMGLVIVSSSLAAPRPAAAAATDVYDTVDSAEVNNADPTLSGNPSLSVTGIPAGGTTPITKTYVFAGVGTPGNLDTAMHCQRLAVLAMSKPGKFQFAIGPALPTSAHGCKLIVRTS